jgi:hypothetical protein
MITRRRLCLCLCLTLLLVALLPAVHWRLIGWVKGEAFYQGRPTSWWSREVDNLTKPSWIDQYLGRANRDEAELALVTRDREAIPVLIELLHDSSRDVRLFAVEGLFYFGHEAKSAVGPLLQLWYDEDMWVRSRAREALEVIDIDEYLKAQRHGFSLEQKILY